jgi:hypothetical protein
LGFHQRVSRLQNVAEKLKIRYGKNKTIPSRVKGRLDPIFFTAGNFTGNNIMSHGKQVSPDKNVNFPCATASFTVSPVPWALTCCAVLPRDSALYDVSIRQLTSLPSGFLQTLPRDNALAFG